MSDITITVRNEGTIFLFHPNTEAGQKWLEEWTDGQWHAGSLVVEHRYAYDLVQDAFWDGLEVDSSYTKPLTGE